MKESDVRPSGQPSWVRRVVLLIVASSLFAFGTSRDVDEVFRFQTGHTRDILYVGWSPDSTRLISYSWADEALRLWDVDSGRVIASFRTGTLGPTPTKDDLSGVAATRPEKNLLEFHDSTTHELLWRIRMNASNSSSLSPDGRFRAEGGRYGDAAIRILDAKTGTLIRRLEGHPGIVYALAFSPDGSILGSGSGNRTVMLRRSDDGTVLRVLRGHEAPVTALAFSRDGVTVASADDEGVVVLWYVSTGERAGTLELDSVKRLPVYALTFSGDGRLIAAGTQAGFVFVWEVKNGRLVRKSMNNVTEESVIHGAAFAICCAAVRALAFDSSSQLLAAASDGGWLHTWNVGSGRLVNSEKGPEADVHALRRDRDEWRWLKGGREAKAVAAFGKKKRVRLRGDEAAFITSAVISEDGKQAATGGIAGEIAIWDLRTGRRLLAIEDSHSVLAVAISPDGSRLAAGGENQTIRAWDAAKGMLQWDASGPPGGDNEPNTALSCCFRAPAPP